MSRRISSAGVAVAAVVASLLAPGPVFALGDANEAFCPNESLPGFQPYLPDCRAYEMVSPPFKGGAGITRSSLDGVSADGSRVLVSSTGAFAGTENLPQNSFLTGAVYDLARSGSGWTASPLTPPASLSQNAVYQGSSAGATRVLWEVSGSSGSAYAADLAVREPDGTFVRIGPLFSPAGAAGPPAGTENGLHQAVQLTGASKDLSHVLFWISSENPALLWSGDTTVTDSYSLYEYVGVGNTHPMLVGVNAEGHLISNCETGLGSSVAGGGTEDQYNAVSANGETVFFTAAGRDRTFCGAGANEHAVAPEVTELYARLAESQTVAISEPSPWQCAECNTPATAAEGRRPAVFEGASEDGSKVFFLTEQELFKGDTTGNLYEWDFNNLKQRKIVRVSQGFSKPEVQGVARVSEDGSHVYFVAKGVFATTGTATTTSGSNTLTAVTTATGTGTLTSGSQTVEGVVTSTGAFAVGQTISGTGIPAATEITGVELAAGRLRLSAAATASGAQVLSAGAQPFAKGEIVAGAGIPLGATITAVNGQTLTLSANATASASGVTVTVANREGNAPTSDANNLYVFERDAAYPGGRTAFIATLSSETEAELKTAEEPCAALIEVEEKEECENRATRKFRERNEADHGDWSSVDLRPVQATPDGRFLVFSSAADLTEGDTAPEEDPQVFEYDALREKLVRVSIGEEGYAAGAAHANANPSLIASQDYVENTLPTAPTTSLMVSADGSRVLFQSLGALTEGAETAAAAGAKSVYEYRSTGSIENGDVYLISDGTNASSAEPIGLSPSGADAFFRTADPLLPSDVDTAFDIYDARVGGGFPAPPAPAACVGDACQGAVSAPPSFGAPGSATFSGSGNLTPPLSTPVKPKTAAQIKAEKLAKALKTCRAKHSRHKRAVCESQARRRYGASKAKKSANTNRRAK